MDDPNVDLSIIIPAYQEAERIGGTLDALAQHLQEKDYGRVEVLVVVAQSPDGTVDVAQSKADKFESFRVIDAGPRRGKGRDVRLGMREASGAYKLFMDADLATPLHHMQTVKQHSQAGKDIIICVRNLHETHTGLRKLISSVGNLLVRIVLGLRIQDTQCGFKAFRREVANDLFNKQRILGWGFDMEILAIAHNRGYSIETIEANDWRDVAGGTLNNVAVTGALSTFKELLTIKWNLITGKYKQDKGE